MSKFDVRRIIKDHYRTLYENTDSGRSLRLGVLAIVVVPTLAALLMVLLGARIYELGDLLAAVAVLAGFLFALLIVLLETAVETSGRAEEQGPSVRINRRILILREVTANVAYAVLMAVVAVVLIGAARLVDKPSSPLEAPQALPSWYCGVVFALLIHLVLTLVMVLKRVYAVAHRELDYAAVPEARGPLHSPGRGAE